MGHRRRRVPWLAPGEMVRGLAHTLDLPELATIKPVSVEIALVAALLRCSGSRGSVPRTLGVGAVLGLLAGLIGLA